MADDWTVHVVTCEECGGLGVLSLNGTCYACEGSGRIVIEGPDEEAQEAEVADPPGLEPGSSG